MVRYSFRVEVEQEAQWKEYYHQNKSRLGDHPSLSGKKLVHNTIRARLKSFFCINHYIKYLFLFEFFIIGKICFNLDIRYTTMRLTSYLEQLKHSMIQRFYNRLLTKNLEISKYLPKLIHKATDTSSVMNETSNLSHKYENRLEDDPNLPGKNLIHNTTRSKLKSFFCFNYQIEYIDVSTNYWQWSDYD